MNHYETLGVPKDVDAVELKSAYRKKASKAHPDKDGGSDKAFQAVKLAYDVLANPERREHYDRTGEDETPERARAHDLLLSLFDQLIAQTSFQGDYIQAASMSTASALADLRKAQAKTKAEIERLTKLQSRVVSTGENAFAVLTAKRIEAAQEKHDALSAEIDEVVVMHGLLKEYRDTDPTIITVRSAFGDITRRDFWGSNQERFT